jgi:hypothetical protein
MAMSSWMHWIIFLVIAAVLVRLVVKPFLSPEARQISKVFLLLPLLVVGSLLLAFVVLAVVYWSTARFGGPEIHTAILDDDGTKGTQVSISPNGIVVHTAAPATPPAPPPSLSGPSPSRPQPPTTGATDPSGVTSVWRAMKSAFITAMRSKGQPTPPAARDAPASSKDNRIVHRPAPPTSPAASPGPAVASAPVARPAVAAPPALASASAATATKRPDWVDNPPQGSADRYEVAVKSDPWKTRLECEQALDEEIQWAVGDYVAWRIGEPARWQAQLSPDYARQYLVKEQWLEKVNTSLGEMVDLHALLCFDRQVEGKLQDAWKETVLGMRLVLSGAALGGVVLLLSVVYGYLKIDLATAGAYRGRLRFAAAAMVLGLAAAGAAFWHFSGVVRNV